MAVLFIPSVRFVWTSDRSSVRAEFLLFLALHPQQKTERQSFQVTLAESNCATNQAATRFSRASGRALQRPTAST